MLMKYNTHNRFKENLDTFKKNDPHLMELASLTYQYSPNWWQQIDFNVPGIYIVTGGRQIGKSTSCKMLIHDCLKKKIFDKHHTFYLPCDEIIDAKEFSNILRLFLEGIGQQHFLLVIDEVTYVNNWDRVIKALADEGHFKHGCCIITGSDTLILKEAMTRFPGRRGRADQTNFHLYPLSFKEYVSLRSPKKSPLPHECLALFNDYLFCGGYLRAINDVAETGSIRPATYLTYEEWIRGDFLKQGKNDKTLMLILQALFTIGVSQTSYGTLTSKIGEISKETCIDYCNLLERMDILISLQSFDQNKKMGFPKKDKKFHFTDPFIYRTIVHWLTREGLMQPLINESTLVEATVASHCKRLGKTFYFKGQGEVDVITFRNNTVKALEVKWAEQIRSNDLKTLKNFKNSAILTKNSHRGLIDNIACLPVFEYLLEMP